MESTSALISFKLPRVPSFTDSTILFRPASSLFYASPSLKISAIEESLPSVELTPSSDITQIRKAEDVERPLPERDRGLPNQYDDERRIDRDPDRWDFRGRYGY